MDFESTLPLKKLSKLGLPDMVKTILHKSGGNLGNVKNLLVASAIEAIENRSECITADIIRQQRDFRTTLKGSM